MIHKWQQKEKARKLRKLGWIYKEISEKVPAHRTTLTNWCKDIKLTSEQIFSRGKRYANGLKGARANQIKRQRQIEEIKIKAKKEIRSLTDYEFKLAGLALYWAEGGKTKGTSIVNSNPELIKFATKWFKKVCNVSDDKLNAYLHLHSGHNEAKIKKYWSKITNVPLQKFGKSFIKEEGYGHKKNDLYKGTIRIRINNEDLRHKIMGWIEGIYIK